MSTVGYGDMTPKTLFGRFFAFLLSIWGVFIISLVVLLFFNLIQFSDHEAMALKVYDRMHYRDEMMKEAAIILGKMTKIRKYFNAKKNDTVISMATDFKKNIAQFRHKAE